VHDEKTVLGMRPLRASVIDINDFCKPCSPCNTCVADVIDSTEVTTPLVKTWFIVRRLFEPEELSDAAPADGGGDSAAHVTVKVENAVLDGGVTKEVI